MGIDIRLPQISGASEREQLTQVKSYLYQLAQQLQWALKNIDTTTTTVVTPTPKSLVSADTQTEVNAYTTFNSIKALIIKSADIVEAFTQEINQKLEGKYVAVLDSSLEKAKEELLDSIEGVDSDLQDTKTDVKGRIDDINGSVAGLGVGLNDVNSKIADVDQDLQVSKGLINESIQGVQESVAVVNALLEAAIAQLNGSLEDIEADVTDLQQVIIGVTAYLKSGLLYTTDAGIPVYGLEIGQSVRDEVAGIEVFNKYARFTSEKLSFYDSNGIEVAYIRDKKLYIRMAHITVSLQLGGLISLVMANGDVVEKWVGIGG